MITPDHVGFAVADYTRSKAFYEQALAPLGIALLMKFSGAVQVDAFHAAAIEAGGTDNGGPGLRWYHPDYYGGYVLDPDSSL